MEGAVGAPSPDRLARDAKILALRRQLELLDARIPRPTSHATAAVVLSPPAHWGAQRVSPDRPSSSAPLSASKLRTTRTEIAILTMRARDAAARVVRRALRMWISRWRVAAAAQRTRELAQQHAAAIVMQCAWRSYAARLERRRRARTRAMHAVTDAHRSADTAPTLRSLEYRLVVAISEAAREASAAEARASASQRQRQRDGAVSPAPTSLGFTGRLSSQAAAATKVPPPASPEPTPRQSMWVLDEHDNPVFVGDGSGAAVLAPPDGRRGSDGRSRHGESQHVRTGHVSWESDGARRSIDGATTAHSRRGTGERQEVGRGHDSSARVGGIAPNAGTGACGVAEGSTAVEPPHARMAAVCTPATAASLVADRQQQQLTPTATASLLLERQQQLSAASTPGRKISSASTPARAAPTAAPSAGSAAATVSTLTLRGTTDNHSGLPRIVQGASAVEAAPGDRGSRLLAAVDAALRALRDGDHGAAWDAMRSVDAAECSAGTASLGVTVPSALRGDEVEHFKLNEGTVVVVDSSEAPDHRGVRLKSSAFTATGLELDFNISPRNHRHGSRSDATPHSARGSGNSNGGGAETQPSSPVKHLHRLAHLLDEASATAPAASATASTAAVGTGSKAAKNTWTEDYFNTRLQVDIDALESLVAAPPPHAAASAAAAAAAAVPQPSPSIGEPAAAPAGTWAARLAAVTAAATVALPIRLHEPVTPVYPPAGVVPHAQAALRLIAAVAVGGRSGTSSSSASADVAESSVWDGASGVTSRWMLNFDLPAATAAAAAPVTPDNDEALLNRSPPQHARPRPAEAHTPLLPADALASDQLGRPHVDAPTGVELGLQRLEEVLNAPTINARSAFVDADIAVVATALHPRVCNTGDAELRENDAPGSSTDVPPWRDPAKRVNLRGRDVSVEVRVPRYALLSTIADDSAVQGTECSDPRHHSELHRDTPMYTPVDGGGAAAMAGSPQPRSSPPPLPPQSEMQEEHTPSRWPFSVVARSPQLPPPPEGPPPAVFATEDVLTPPSAAVAACSSTSVATSAQSEAAAARPDAVADTTIAAAADAVPSLPQVEPPTSDTASPTPHVASALELDGSHGADSARSRVSSASSGAMLHAAAAMSDAAARLTRAADAAVLIITHTRPGHAIGTVPSKG